MPPSVNQATPATAVIHRLDGVERGVTSSREWQGCRQKSLLPLAFWVTFGIEATVVLVGHALADAFASLGRVGTLVTNRSFSPMSEDGSSPSGRWL